MGTPLVAQGRVETLRWQNTDPDPARIVGFTVHAGSSSRSYNTHLAIGKPTPDANGIFSYDLAVPDAATVYVAVTAYDGTLESAYSNEQLRAPAGAPPPNQAPAGTIDAPGGPVSIMAGETVSFQGTGSDPDGDLPLTYLWNFGGSGVASSTAEDPGAVTFATAGTFTVRFTVTDARGLADGTPATRVVTVVPLPIDPSDPSATDVTIGAGVTYLQFDASAPASASGFEYMTGGAAAGDYDGDGWVDLYVTLPDAPDILFRNRGDGSFDDVTAEAGLDLDLPTNGAAWGDLDNDGDLDLYLTAAGGAARRFYLFINDGAGRFSEQAVARGAAVEGPDAHFGFSVTFGDYDLDGWLDIHTTEWRLDADNPLGARSNARLLHNRGSRAPGFFEDVTDIAGVALEGVPVGVPGVSGVVALTSRFADLDGDGWPDLLVTSDFGTSRLFWNSRDGTFRDGTVAAGVGTEEHGTGSAVGDYDGDGRLDWFVTSPSCFTSNPSCTGNRLYRNQGGRVFSDRTDAAGVRNGFYGTAAAFYDLENDGDLDLVMTNGDFAAPGASAPDPMRVWENNGRGQMTEVSQDVGMTDDGAGRGLLTFDYDADGDLDLFVVNNADSPVLYRNDSGSQNDWLRVKTQGRDSNRDGIGAVVLLWKDAASRPQIREIEAGSHFLGQSESTAHFGLGGGAEPVDRVLVYWPATDRTNEFLEVPRNTTLLAVEPASDRADDSTPPQASGSSSGGSSSSTTTSRSSSGGGGSGSSCGLLGIEPLVLLPFLARRKRRRRTSL